MPFSPVAMPMPAPQPAAAPSTPTASGLGQTDADDLATGRTESPQQGRRTRALGLRMENVL